MAGRILIVDDIATNRIVLNFKLTAALYETAQATSAAEAIAKAKDLRPDLIIVNVELRDINGIELCRRLGSDHLTRDIPIVMTSARRDRDRKIQALRAGAAEVFWKPLDDSLFLARLRSLLRAREREKELGVPAAYAPPSGFAEGIAGYEGPGHVAIVGSQIDWAHRLMRDLVQATADRLCVLHDDAALSLSEASPAPDVFLVLADGGRPDKTLRLLSELRSRPLTRNSATCVLVPERAATLGAIALDLGANDVIEGTAEISELVLRLSRQLQGKRRADRQRSSLADELRMAVTDPLTGLHNRRYALREIQRIDEQTRLSGRAYAVMMLDVDWFKTINDSFGHAAGDAVLVQMADRLRANLRPGDLVARLGGEEFVIATADTSLRAAQALAERIRHAIEETPFVLADGMPIGVTLSVGLTMGGGDTAPSSVSALLEAADQALFRSKSEGRNLVSVSRSAA